MDKEYKELLIRSIKATETSANAAIALAETQKAINDTLVSHNKTIAEIYQLSCDGNSLSQANNTILMSYLKWAIIALVLTLGGAKLFAQVKDIIVQYAL